MFRHQLQRSSRALSKQISQTPRTYLPSSQSHFSSLSPRISRIAPSTASSSQLFTRRWQSTEAQKSEEKPPEGAAAQSGTAADDATKAEMEKKNKEIIDLKDKYLRSVADYRNLQDRTTRDNANARQFAIQKFAVDLLDSIDNLDRALAAVPDAALGKSSSSSSGTVTSNTSSADANTAAPTESTPQPSSQPNKDLLTLYNGLKMTQDIMTTTLKKHGLERFDPLEREGQKFDPNVDEATFFAPQEGKENGTVFYTQQTGFLLNGRVVRASKVGVVKNS